ncbi:hypothetical protein [Endothiovibrio diazotrophicus]
MPTTDRPGLNIIREECALALGELVAAHGPALLSDPRRIKGLLVDDCSQRVLCGGSWRESPRAAPRRKSATDFRSDDLGFRLARDL